MKTIILLAALFISLGAIACGGDETEPGTAGSTQTGDNSSKPAGTIDNVGACQSWAKSISCGSFVPTDQIKCESFSAHKCDVADYFNCLKSNFKCTDMSGQSVPDVSGWMNCRIPSCN